MILLKVSLHDITALALDGDGLGKAICRSCFSIKTLKIFLMKKCDSAESFFGILEMRI